ncbi:potassium channel family protein [Bradyrhizobium sp. 31Argb]|uniref:potassium channel family protein n=1 Tax=unclassified Bradyrhizobium TaxID=2631580 RepID=UPI00102E96B1|nr:MULTISPECIES: potassium channel family protein [unclassified Bradyrhizobium]MDI4234778.1 potassium channel family protein [Bradyrhizobium sp. Arg237L]TAI64582.1 two pore domain potassium channel family protein [Bradyrhizobium sp. Leo170]
MALQFLVGAVISVVNIMIHALVTVAVVAIARIAEQRHPVWPRLHLMGVMVVVAILLMLAHTLDVFVWALAYAIVGAAPAGADLVYFAFVNYTTLGYGDITPAASWRLTGPITAMNGILMFGWSTALLFEVLRRSYDHLASIAEPGGPFSSANRGPPTGAGPGARSGAGCCR